MTSGWTAISARRPAPLLERSRVTYRDRIVFEIAYVDDAEFLHCRAEHGLESDEDRLMRDWLDSIYLDEHPSQFIASLRG
jgi:hypothetical protein